LSEFGAWAILGKISPGRLITVTDGTDTYAYRYDGDGNRFERIINGTLITHSLDAGLALLL
jgi:YD repeat-containing protein